MLGLALFLLNLRFIACVNLHGYTEIMRTIIRVQNIMNQGLHINITKAFKSNKEEHRRKNAVIILFARPWTERRYTLLLGIKESIRISFVFGVCTPWKL